LDYKRQSNYIFSWINGSQVIKSNVSGTQINHPTKIHQIKRKEEKKRKKVMLGCTKKKMLNGVHQHRLKVFLFETISHSLVRMLARTIGLIVKHRRGVVSK